MDSRNRLLLIAAVVGLALAAPYLMPHEAEPSAPTKAAAAPNAKPDAKAEKPSPPYSLGIIMPQKRFFLMKAHTCGGKSRSSQLIFHSSHIAQSCSTGPSRNAFSSAESFACGMASR